MPGGLVLDPKRKAMMKRRVLILAVATAGLLAMAGCEEATPDTLGDTLDDTVTTQTDEDPAVTGQTESTDTGSDPAALVARLQTELMVLAEEIRSSEAADTLEEAWGDLETQVSSAVENVDADGTIDTSELEDDLDEFQATLDSLGDDVEAEVRDAWSSFRSTLEQLTG